MNGLISVAVEGLETGSEYSTGAGHCYPGMKWRSHFADYLFLSEIEIAYQSWYSSTISALSSMA